MIPDLGNPTYREVGYPAAGEPRAYSVGGGGGGGGVRGGSANPPFGSELFFNNICAQGKYVTGSEG